MCIRDRPRPRAQGGLRLAPLGGRSLGEGAIASAMGRACGFALRGFRHLAIATSDPLIPVFMGRSGISTKCG
eukprot:13506507-Alexandrium_andersonii.AAC.1